MFEVSNSREGKMNITEKQKQILINFMRSHPDFGRGRLRYSRENKRKIDELWEEVSSALNCAGCGPKKLPKEWAKTWRDWKCNLLHNIWNKNKYIFSLIIVFINIISFTI